MMKKLSITSPPDPDKNNNDFHIIKEAQGVNKSKAPMSSYIGSFIVEKKKQVETTPNDTQPIDSLDQVKPQCNPYEFFASPSPVSGNNDESSKFTLFHDQGLDIQLDCDNLTNELSLSVDGDLTNLFNYNNN